MTQINQTSFLVQKSKSKNMKPGGVKKASQNRDANQHSTICHLKQDLSAKAALSKFLMPSNTTIFEISNQSEDDEELDGPDDDEDMDDEEEDDYDEDDDEDNE
jgi:hypothetical protein